MNLVLINNTIYINELNETLGKTGVKKRTSIKNRMHILNKYSIIIKNHKYLDKINNYDFKKFVEYLGKNYVVQSKESDIFYKNFPEEVKNMTDEQLYYNALMYYILGSPYGYGLGDIRIFNQIKKARKNLKTQNYKIVRIIHKNFNKLVTEILNMKQITEEQREIVKELLKNGYSYLGNINDIESRENKALILKEKFLNGESCIEYINSSNDILNLLRKNKAQEIHIQFLKLKRKERRIILDILENLLEKDEMRILSEIKRQKKVWKILFNLLHPFEYKFEKIKKMCEDIYGNKRIVSQNSILEEKIANEDKSIFEDYENNPTELVRRLNKLLKIFDLEIIESFLKKSIDKISVDVLCTLYKYEYVKFGDKNIIEYSNNIVIIKDRKENNIEKIKNIVKEELKKRFKNYDTIYIPKKYYNVALPLKLRNSNQLNKTLSIGSRLKVEGEILRFFIYWKGYDLDLSAYFIDSNYNEINHVSYQNLKEDGITHSGDITNAPDGASEYIDVEINNINSEIRYILIYVNEYSGITFDQLKECYAGYMTLDDNISGEIYDINTVENTFRINSNSTVVYPLMVDLINKEMIIIDKDIKSLKNAADASSMSEVSEIITAFFAQKKYFTIKDYIDLMEIKVEEKSNNRINEEVIFNNLELYKKIIL